MLINTNMIMDCVFQHSNKGNNIVFCSYENNIYSFCKGENMTSAQKYLLSHLQQSLLTMNEIRVNSVYQSVMSV